MTAAHHRRTDVVESSSRRYSRVFVLAANPDDLVALTRCLTDVPGYSVGFRSRAEGHLHDTRFEYPEKHIELDDSLVWFLGPILARFATDDTLFVHVRGDRQAAITAALRRWDENSGLLSAFGHGMIMKQRDWQPEERVELCAMYVDSVEANLREFVPRAPHHLTIEMGTVGLASLLETIGQGEHFERAVDQLVPSAELAHSTIALTDARNSLQVIDRQEERLRTLLEDTTREVGRLEGATARVRESVTETEALIETELRRRAAAVAALEGALVDHDPDWDTRWNPQGVGLADVEEAKRRARLRLAARESEMKAPREAGELSERLRRAEGLVDRWVLRARVEEARRRRLEGRRWFRLLGAVSAWSKRPWRVDRLVRGVGAALRKVPLPEIPTELEESSERTETLGAATVLPYPNLRVAHAGSLGMFSEVAPYMDVGSLDLASELELGFDMLLLEPGVGDLLADVSPETVAAFRDKAIPVVFVARTIAHLSLLSELGADLVVTEDPTLAERAERGGYRVLLLDPSVDEQVHNPIGWVRSPQEKLLVISDRENPGDDVSLLQPVADRITVYGTPIRRLTPRKHHAGRPIGPDQAATAKNHIAAFTSPNLTIDHVAHIQQALEYVATGTPLFAPPSPQLDRLLGDHYQPVNDPDDIRQALEQLDDPITREHLSVRARRHVLTHHTRRHRFEQILQHLDIPTNPTPRISILLCTKRPENIDHALENATRLDWPDKELLLILHGTDGFDLDQLTTKLDNLPYPAKLLPCPAKWTFGDCLNHGLDHATGTYITKIDDDDHYGPNHLIDLYTAHTYSRAHVTGKWGNVVYIVRYDLMIDWRTEREESFGPHLPGATFLMDRQLLGRYRFSRVNRSVDATLWKRMRKDGCRLYSTHRFNFVRMRHPSNTYQQDEAHWLGGSKGHLDRGLHPERAFL